MENMLGKLRLLLLSGLSAFFGYLITVFSLFGPCYNGCTISSFFVDVIEGLPVSLITLFILLCAGLLYLLAVYLFLSIFSSKLKFMQWMYILLTTAVTPMLLLALYGLVFDFGDAVIYGPLALIAMSILFLIWYPRWKNRINVTSHERLLS